MQHVSACCTWFGSFNSTTSSSLYTCRDTETQRSKLKKNCFIKLLKAYFICTSDVERHEMLWIRAALKHQFVSFPSSKQFFFFPGPVVGSVPTVISMLVDFLHRKCDVMASPDQLSLWALGWTEQSVYAALISHKTQNIHFCLFEKSTFLGWFVKTQKRWKTLTLVTSWSQWDSCSPSWYCTTQNMSQDKQPFGQQ